MSYDIYFQIDTGGAEETVVEQRNYTSNVVGMWAKALELSGLVEPGTGLADVIEGKSTRQLGVITRAAALEMAKAGEAAFADLAPANGWGSYAGALDYLEWIAGMCAGHPRCTVRLWR